MAWRFNRIDETGKPLRYCWTARCQDCPIKALCTPAKLRRISRWDRASTEST